MNRPVHIRAARRSIVAPPGGALRHLDPHDMAAPVIAQVLADAGLTREAVDELIVSNALGAGGNPARIAALAAGLPRTVAGLSIDRQCCGGLDALLIGQALIASGQADTVLAGGVETHSRRPYRARRAPDGSLQPYEQAAFTPWPDRDPDMHEAAATLAVKLGVSRARQDDWTRASHAKARAAQSRLRAEIVPLSGETEPVDSYTRDMTPALAARARPLSGNITQANTSVAADGAAFVLLSARPATGALRLIGGATVGDDPELPGLGPVAATRVALRNAKLATADLTVVELMEAYAVQAIACADALGLDPALINPGGGSLARGHPIGASGAILAVRLFHELRALGGAGLATIAAAGGLGTALLMRQP